MKKNYQTPVVEKVAFAYRDQVVVASGGYWESQCSGGINMVNTGCSDNEYGSGPVYG